MDYLVKLQEFTLGEVVAEILTAEPSRGEPTIEVTLFQGLPKSDKFELIVQKCTELGIHRIVPVETSRSIVKLNDKKADRRVERWQKIAEEAAKQSARGRIPVVGNVVSWKELISTLQKEPFALFIVPWEEAKEISIRQVLQSVRTGDSAPKRIAYMIGPEGGLSPEEVQALITLGARPVTLGPRILRTETAGFTVLTVLMYEFLQMEGCDRR
jgi:16S rRNA (uracil1498-N3)-methyltransferase